MNNIKLELERKNPSTVRILSYLYDVYDKNDYQFFLDIAVEIYKIKSNFFLKAIHPRLSAPPKVKEEIISHIILNVNLEEGEQILKNIRELLEAKKPSRSKILTHLFEQHLVPYSEFFEIIGETYKLYPMFFLKSLYKDIKKKTGKLYGLGKLEVLEKFIVENYGLKSGEQILDSIREELKKARPIKSLILSKLFDFQLIYPSVLFDVVGRTFKLNPEFYMNNLYGNLETRITKLYGKGTTEEMQKHIIENFCLNDGEQILYECPSNSINYWENPVLKSRGLRVIGATLFVTNYRIIANGLMWRTGGEFTTGRRALKTIMDLSIKQDCYGYVFPIKNLIRLKKTSKGVSYDTLLNVNNTNRLRNISIKLTRSPEREEQKNKLFEILVKEVDEKNEKIEYQY
jgi:hypothetical protein